MDKITFLVEATSTGFSAASLDYGIVSTGATRDELTRNLVEALHVYLAETGSPQPITAENLDLVDAE